MVAMQMVQPMMPGMAPPPPGAYIPGPYMQPMPYHMPPPNRTFMICTRLKIPGVHCCLAMYPSTPMGQMPRMSYVFLSSTVDSR